MMQRSDKPYVTTFTLEKPTERDWDLFPVFCKLVEEIRGKIQVDEKLVLRHTISSNEDTNGNHQINIIFSIEGVESQVILGDDFQNEFEFLEVAAPRLIELIKSK